MSTALVSQTNSNTFDRDHRQLLEYIYDELKNGNSVAIEAYPGFGKTRLGSQLLMRFDRIAMVVRTHQEMIEVFNFISKAKNIVYVYGKPKLCFQTNNFSYGFCRAMLFFGRCNTNVTNKDVAWLASTFRKPEEIREEARKRNKCLYFGLRILVQKAKKIVTTYDYLVSHPQALDRKEAVVLDESHTLLNYLDEAVVAVNEAFIELLTKSMKNNLDTRWMAYAIKSIYRKSSNIHEFIDKLSTIYSSYSGPDTEEIKIIDEILQSYRRKHYIYSRDDKTYYFLLGTLPRIAKFEPKVILGAYLLPIFVSATKNVIKITGESRIRTIVDTDLTSRYEERSEDTYIGYAKKLSEYVRSDVGNLAVFPSTEFMFEVMKKSKIIDKVITEPINGEIPPGRVLVDVAGGRYTEGVNIKGISNVIVCGMPYPEPNPILDLVSDVYKHDLYTYIALLRTIQSIGRIRNNGTSYIIDKRYIQHIDKFPKWITLSTK
ncbi:MAG: helicase C-terminal domain-containing protein [Ignisphaera sp.]